MRHIIGKDLNLLLVFAALWRERNVTKAAKTIGMTQPALSRALGRLRVEFSDPLFVRVARGVSPTDRAMGIAETIADLLEAAEGVYASEGKFRPGSFKDTVTISTNDYFQTLAATRLIPRIAKEAPGMALNFLTGDGAIPKEALERGNVDLVIAGIYENLPEGFYHQKILTDRYRSAVRRDYPSKTLTVEQFAKLSHVLVTPRGDLKGIVDNALEKLGKQRRVVIGSSNFLSAGWVVAHSDFVLSAPGRIIDSLCEYLPLRDFPTPVPIPHLELFQVWHSRTHHDPAQKWLRQRISECGKKG